MKILETEHGHYEIPDDSKDLLYTFRNVITFLAITQSFNPHYVRYERFFDLMRELDVPDNYDYLGYTEEEKETELVQQAYWFMRGEYKYIPKSE